MRIGVAGHHPDLDGQKAVLFGILHGAEICSLQFDGVLPTNQSSRDADNTARPGVTDPRSDPKLG